MWQYLHWFKLSELNTNSSNMTEWGITVTSVTEPSLSRRRWLDTNNTNMKEWGMDVTYVNTRLLHRVIWHYTNSLYMKEWDMAATSVTTNLIRKLVWHITNSPSINSEIWLWLLGRVIWLDTSSPNIKISLSVINITVITCSQQCNWTCFSYPCDCFI